MSKIYVVSDTHIDGRMKQLENAARINWRYDDPDYVKKLLENWRTKVKPEDTVIHVGDVIGNAPYNNMYGQIIRDLPGYKILVRGNHDSGNIKKWQSCFQEVVDTYVHENVVFCHYPVNPIEFGVEYSVYGHVHCHPKTRLEGYWGPRALQDRNLRRASAYFSFEKNLCFVLPEWEYDLPELDTFLEKRIEAGIAQEQRLNKYTIA